MTGQSDKLIQLKSGKKVNVNSGDTLIVTIPNESFQYKGRFIDIQNGIVKLWIIGPEYKITDLEVKEALIIDVEKAN